MKERLHAACGERMFVYTLAVLFRATEAAQDPCPQTDDVLCRVGPAAPAVLRPSDPGASCLPAGKVRMGL